MKPLNCCKGCNELNKNGTFKNKLKCIMSCDKYTLEETKMLYNEQKGIKGCSTCKHCEHIHNYPGYVSAEESICRAGLECDTVCFTVKNCPKYLHKV